MNKRQMKKLYKRAFQGYESCYPQYSEALTSLMNRFMIRSCEFKLNKDGSVSPYPVYPKGWYSWSIHKQVRYIIADSK